MSNSATLHSSYPMIDNRKPQLNLQMHLASWQETRVLIINTTAEIRGRASHQIVIRRRPAVNSDVEIPRVVQV